MLNYFVVLDTLKDILFPAEVFIRNDQRNIFSDRLLGCITEHFFTTLVPATDSTIQGFADNGVIRGFNNGSKAPEIIFIFYRGGIHLSFSQDLLNRNYYSCFFWLVHKFHGLLF